MDYYDSEGLHRNPFSDDRDDTRQTSITSSTEGNDDMLNSQSPTSPTVHHYDERLPTDHRHDIYESSNTMEPTNSEDTEPTEHPEDISGGGAEGDGAGAATTTGSAGPPVPNKEQQQPAAPPRKLKKYKLILKVTGLERNGKKDPIIKFDAYTTLPRFRTTTFRDVRRTHHECVKFFEHLNGANPECFVPAVPKSVSSVGAGTEEDEVKVKARMQLWLDRISSNPILARDEEFVHFIEADFGYTPVVKGRPPATGLTRKAMKQLAPPPDDVEELRDLRPLVKRVYQLATDAQAKLDKITKTRRSLGLALNEMSNKCGGFAVQQAQSQSLHSVTDSINSNANANMWRKFCRAVGTQSDIAALQATNEAASFGDGLEMVAANAYVAKEALTNRHLLMRELHKAQKETKTRHQTAVRVRASSSISPSKADDALAALEEATRTEERLTGKVRRVSDNMLLEKHQLLTFLEQDLRAAVSEYALRTIDCERRSLTVWESIRVDVRAADAAGGLSRLGRDAHPTTVRRTPLVHSQGATGDAWSGDRIRRASELKEEHLHHHDRSLPSPIDHDTRGGLSGSRSPDEISDQAETVVDARNAASMLAGSTF